MMYRTTTKGGGRYALLLYITLIVLSVNFPVYADSLYRGLLRHFDFVPNRNFTINQDGDVQIGEYFSPNICSHMCEFDPTGNIVLGTDSDILTTLTIKWYMIQDGEFIESTQQLPSPYLGPTMWTETPFRAIVGVYPSRVWQFDPDTLSACLLSEYLEDEAWGSLCAYVPDLGYVYYSDAFNLRRLNYDDSTGVISGPVVLFPTPHRGGVDLAQTSDGRTLIQLSDDGYLTIYKVEINGSVTLTYDAEMYLEYDIPNLDSLTISHDDKYIFIIARDNNNVNSFEITPEGTIEPITLWTGFELAQALALTPDGKFLLVSHHYTSGYPHAILSVFEVGSDGSLDWLPDKDVYLDNMPFELTFFPPQRQPTASRPAWNYYE